MVRHITTSEEEGRPMKRNGHTPGHVRETAGNAFEAWIDWNGKGPQPTVEFEVDYVPQQIPISHALRLVWNCTDIIPGYLFERIQEAVTSGWDKEPAIKQRTYAACARAVLRTAGSKTTKREVAISERALVARINRKLAPDLEQLHKSRRLDVGDYYLVDHRINGVIGKDVDVEALARELGVIKEWEKVAWL
jgi:hypothetical protein